MIPRSDFPIVIWNEGSTPADQDCACADQPDLLWNDIQSSPETDCACANVIPAAHAFAYPDIVETAPGLMSWPLEDVGFYAVCAPAACTGSIALNTAAMQYLHHYDQPRRFAAAGKLAQLEHRLYGLGLLVDPQQKHRLPMEKPHTLTAWLHVTNSCNLSCAYCYVPKTQEHMTVETARQVVDAAFRSAGADGFGRVKLKYAGGEPVLNPAGIFAADDHACEKAAETGIAVSGVILSNGTLFGECFLNEVARRGLRLALSLDGVGLVHDRQRSGSRGNGSFHHLEKGLDKLKSFGIAPTITITVTSGNLADLPQTVDYLLQRRLRFSINFYRPNQYSVGLLDLTLDEDEAICVMHRVFAVIRADLPDYSLLGLLTDRARLDAPHTRPCGVGAAYLVFDQRGRAAKCHMEIDHTIADTNTPDLLATLGDDCSSFVNTTVDKKVSCRECDWRYWCAGGCPALTYRVTGRSDVRSPNCRIYQALLPEVIKLEASRLVQQHVNMQNIRLIP